MKAFLALIGWYVKTTLALSFWPDGPSLVVDPTELTVNENDLVVICCHLYGGESNDSLQWNNGKNVDIVEIKSNFMGQNVQEACIVMEHSPLHAAGSYECTEADQGLKKVAILRVLAPPRITPTREKVRKGDSVTFNCSSVSYDSVTRLTWMHNQEQESSQDRTVPTHLVLDGHRELSNGEVLYWSRLLLQQTTLDDSGNYSCIDMETGAVARAQLVVTDYTDLQVIPSTQNVMIGEKAVIKCKVVSSNSSSLFWRHSGRTLSTSKWRNPFISMYTIDNGVDARTDGSHLTWSVLHLYRVTSLAQGTYECVDSSTGVIAAAIIHVTYHSNDEQFCETASDCTDVDSSCINFMCVSKTTTSSSNARGKNNADTDDLFFGMKLVFACLISGGIVVGLIMLYAVIKFCHHSCNSESGSSTRRSSNRRSPSVSIIGENDKPPPYDQCLTTTLPPSYEDVTELSEYGSLRRSHQQPTDGATSSNAEIESLSETAASNGGPDVNGRNGVATVNQDSEPRLNVDSDSTRDDNLNT